MRQNLLIFTSFKFIHFLTFWQDPLGPVTLWPDSPDCPYAPDCPNWPECQGAHIAQITGTDQTAQTSKSGQTDQDSQIGQIVQDQRNSDRESFNLYNLIHFLTFGRTSPDPGPSCLKSCSSRIIYIYIYIYIIRVWHFQKTACFFLVFGQWL